VVATGDGLVRGTATTGVDKFLGIPYAAPPVGALRWQPPQPAARWPGVREAGTFGAHCVQPSITGGQSEDCLFLNVFTPSGAPRFVPRPVMVWIHGGALVTGKSDDFDPTQLVRNGVTVVTINYRLGAFGFLAHSSLAATPGGPAGDYGLMDQQAALQWVQRNIARFGGNPRDVTLFGESAGALSTLAQLVSPGGRGLFARAISESGTYNPTQDSLATAEAAGTFFANTAGCTDQTAACLRGLSTAQVLAHENTTGYTPNIDGKVLPQSLKTAFASGQFTRVPVINGTNHDEWRLFVALFQLAGAPVTVANYQSVIASTVNVSPQTAATIAARYPLSAFASPPLAMSAVGTDAIFACNSLNFDQSLSRFTPTFAYEFNDENAPSRLPANLGFPPGTAHGSEIQYIFQTPDTKLSPEQQQLAAAMRHYWTTEAFSGQPNAPGTPFWPIFDGRNQRMQSFVPTTPRPETNFSADHNCDLWSSIQR
jgi:para-nitrobenzyl esterase